MNNISQTTFSNVFSSYNIPALVQIMAWRCSGDKPLSEPMMVSLLTRICVTRPQWVKPCPNGRGIGVFVEKILEKIYCVITAPHSVLEILAGPPVRGRQLWRRTGNFLILCLRVKAWGPTTFLTWVSNTDHTVHFFSVNFKSLQGYTGDIWCVL